MPHFHYAAGYERRQFAQAVAIAQPSLAVIDAEEILQQPKLRHFHGHDQRNGFAIRVQISFVAATNSGRQIDRTAGGFGADFARLLEKRLDQRPVKRMGEQFATAAEIGDVIAAKDEGGGRQPLLKTIHAGGPRDGRELQTRIRGYSRLSSQSGSLYSN